MSAQRRGSRGADSFRKPASYGREAWSDGVGDTYGAGGPGQDDDAGGTRAFSPEELEDARGDVSEDATTLLGAQPAHGQPAHGQAQPAGVRPRHARPGMRQQVPSAGYREPAYPERETDPARQVQPPRADQTLVSPLAQERIRAEVNVPDPAYPPQRQPAARQVPPAPGAAGAAYRPPMQPAQEQPLRRRRQPRPQQPPLAPGGYAYRQAPQQPPYQQQGYQPQFEGEEPGRGHGLARGILLLVSWALRLAALGLVALVVVNCLTMGNRVAIMRITAQVAQLLPRSLAGLYVIDSPFGGVFRGDFAIAAVVLFVLDWIVARIRRRLR